MLKIDYKESFLKTIEKVKDNLTKIKIKKQIKKIIENPEIGKPMMYGRKGTREVYLKPLRISYAYLIEESRIIFLDLYHKDEQ